MSGIYVPIDYSNVKSAIPSGENIIYSTLCSGKSTCTTIRKIVNRDWISHILITNQGLAFNIPKDIRHNPMAYKSKKLNIDISGEEEYYIPLYQVFFFGKVFSFNLEEDYHLTDNIKEVYSKGMYSAPAYSLKLTRNPKFESKKKFNDRSLQFKQKFHPQIKQLRLKYYRALYETFDQSPEITAEVYREKFGPISGPQFLQIKKKWKKRQPPETLRGVK